MDSTEIRPGYTVLLVDDDEDVHAIYPDALRASGFEVLQARNGYEGLETAKRHRPDLIILDGKMPVLGGWDVSRLLKLDAQTARIPILAFTATEITVDQRLTLAEYSDGYITKPSTPSEMLEIVHRWAAPQGSSA